MPEKCQRFSEGKWLARAALCNRATLRPRALRSIP
jgi:hypothetical protein